MAGRAAAALVVGAHSRRLGTRLAPVARLVAVVGVCVGLEYVLTMPSGNPLATVVVLAAMAVIGVWLPVGAVLAAAILAIRLWVGVDVVSEVSMADVLLILVIARLAARMIGADSLPISVPSQWLLLFVLWLWFATLLSHESITPILRLTVYALVAVVLSSQSHPWTRTIYWTFIGFSTVELLVSIPAQFPGRLVGAHIGDPHQLSILCLAALAPLLATTRTFAGRRFLIVLLTVGVLLTRTRGAWGALLVLLVVSQMARLSSRRLVGIMVGFVTAGFILYGPVTQMFGLDANSRNIREQSVVDGVRAGMQSPLVGNGWNASVGDPYAPGRDTSQIDASGRARTQPFNVFVSIFAFTGLPGLILWIGFLVHLMRAVVVRSRPAFLFLAAFLAFSLSEMTIYAGAMGTVIFFVYAGIGQRFPSDGSALLPGPPAVPAPAPAPVETASGGGDPPSV